MYRCSGAAASGRIEMARWCCNKWEQQHKCSAVATGGISRAFTVVNFVAGKATKMIQWCYNVAGGSNREGEVVLHQMGATEKREWCWNRWKQQSTCNGDEVDENNKADLSQ